MKKLIYCALALAAGLFATSCQQENLEPVAQEGTVTYTVEAPMDVQTKAIADGLNVDELIYEVWWTSADGTRDLTNAQRLYQAKTVMVPQEIDGKMVNRSTVTLNLVKDQHYTILFWAQVKGTDVYNTEHLTSVTYKNTSAKAYSANDDRLAAFYAVDFVNDGIAKNSKVILKRPFAQVNLATLNVRDPKNNTEEHPLDYSITLVNSKMTLKQVPTKFNVATSAVSEPKDFEFAYHVVPSTAVAYTTAEGAEYYYAGMNYVFAGANLELTYDIQTRLNGSEQLATITNTIPNVPVKENYRTNIVGNLLTSSTDYEVIVDAAFNTNDKPGNIEVVGEGIVKNVDGDYEVTNERGLAYAINSLFAQGGNFYLTAELYDMTDYDVTAPSVPEDVTLNIYGETPVVTRSATASFAGVTIIGLDSIIDVISEDANVSISGVELTDDGSVLVETNNGTLVVSESTGEENIVGAGEEPVKADDVQNITTLNAALASAVKTINITDSFAAGDVVLVGRSVVINGNDNTFTTSASRAFRLTTSDIEVTFNNLDIVSDAVRVGTNDVRGVSVDDVENITLTLNDCSHDFTDPSANDWAYAVNVTGGTNHTVTINGGVYEGANVINVRGTAQTVTVKNATLNCTYPDNDQYYGACIWVQQKQGSSVYAEGNTFNGNNAIAFNLGTGTALEEKDNVDNTKMVVAKVGQAYYTSLSEAFAAAESGATVKVLHNTEMTPVTVASGKTITLDLNGKTITGIDNASGSYGLITNKGNLTVVGPGSMTLTATNNREWNAYSSVISNTVGGNLTVDGEVVIEHLGGTDMAYGIDNLTNGKGTSAITTVNDATIKSTYRAIRQFLNGVEATNELYVNAEAVIEGANKSIWMQDPSTNANTGKLVVVEGAELYGDVYLFVTAGSTEWPVSASIPTSTLMNGSKVLTGNLPEGYSVEEKNGVYEVTYKSPAQARLEALINEGGEVVLTENIELSSPIEIKNVTVTLDLNGKTITAPLFSAFEVKAGGDLTVKNGKVVAYESTVRAIGGKVTVESGEYTSTGTALDSPATYRYSLDCREGGELIINGGTFKSNNGMINVGSTVTINGGKFENVVEKTMTRHFAYVSAPLTINDGEFYGKANSSAGGCFFCGAAAGGDIQIKGGKFTSLWTSGSVNRIFEVYYGGAINVTGGMFNTNGGIATFVTENTDEATKAAYPYVAK